MLGRSLSGTNSSRKLLTLSYASWTDRRARRFTASISTSFVDSFRNCPSILPWKVLKSSASNLTLSKDGLSAKLPTSSAVEGTLGSSTSSSSSSPDGDSELFLSDRARGTRCVLPATSASHTRAALCLTSLRGEGDTETSTCGAADAASSLTLSLVPSSSAESSELPGPASGSYSCGACDLRGLFASSSSSSVGLGGNPFEGVFLNCITSGFVRDIRCRARANN
mmetsp:Transcript_35612/g.94726  ORF Transcript_35612/g.94726 Transcript_35612/m.94726 type:complete len:224 (+) Transcript_35612:949-1620(+)